MSGATWKIPPGALAVNELHTFTVTVSKGAGDALRRATASLGGVKPRSEPVPTGTISRACGSAGCAPQHNAGGALSLVLQVPAAFSAANVQWSRGDGIALPGGAVSSTGRELALPASALPAGGGAPLVVRANLTFNGVSGVAEIAVPINARPYCAAPGGKGCLSVQVDSDSLLDARFVVTAAGFTDDDGGGAADLRFDWGIVDARSGDLQPQTVDDTRTSRTFAGLELGTTQVYVRASDARGAFALEFANLTVKAPPAGSFSAASAAAAVDVAALAGARDPEVLNRAASSLAAIASFGLAANSTNATETAALRAAVDEKAAGLLKASAAAVDPRDAQAAQAAAFSAVSVVKVMANMSSEAQDAALNIGRMREFVVAAFVLSALCLLCLRTRVLAVSTAF